MSGNQRNFTWLNDSEEHSDYDKARAAALAARWSDLHYQSEQESFRRQADLEDGRGPRDWEPEPCETCGGDGFFGLSGPRNRRGELCNLQDWQVGIRCPSPNCVDGWDHGPIREAEHLERERRAERDLEIEIVEEKLARVGARMMRPYEHWNEDENYVQYMEEGRFGE